MAHFLSLPPLDLFEALLALLPLLQLAHPVWVCRYYLHEFYLLTRC